MTTNTRILIAFMITKGLSVYDAESPDLIEEIEYAKISGNSDEAIVLGTCDLGI